MSVIVAAAENESLKDAVFALRYKVFGEEQTVFALNEKKRTFDRFDSCANTLNHIGFLNERPVASYRISLDSPVGFPVEDHYDLSLIKNIRKESKIGLISLGCIEKGVRSSGVYPLCVYQMGKTLSDSNCDYGMVVIRKDLSDSFAKWGFSPVEHFYCERVSQWLSTMYVEVKHYGKEQTQFFGTAKVENYSRKMTIHLGDREMFQFSQVKPMNINYSHFRVVSGGAKLFFNEVYNSTLRPFEIHRYTHEMNNLKVSILSKGKTEIELLQSQEDL